MRKITSIVLHCTATRAGQPFNIAAIRAMHKARGFSDIGYHWLIGLNGEVWRGRPEEKVGAHVAGFNAFSIGVCYVGGLDASTAVPRDTRTSAQLAAMKKLLQGIVKRYPEVVILGHRDLSPDRDGDGVVEKHEWLKSCPCFDAGPWANANGLPGGRILKGRLVPLRSPG
jgi:N-acetylmuramoyl-L-alanine amidase